MAGSADRIYADPSTERLLTGATVITFVRTVMTLAIAVWGAYESSLTLLVVGLVVYWVGDSIDGEWARWRDCETRIGAVVDMMCDRLSCGALYVGLIWLQPSGWISDEPMTWIGIPIAIYLFEFMVIDMYLSLAFLAWPIRSPNYFGVVDRRIYLWNWSRVGKAANSGAFAVILLVTGWVWLGIVIAVALLVLKCVSLRWLLQLGVPVPVRTADGAPVA
ncbi:CDP-alcohol phosphatidyltransferase family protein [Nocardioides sp. zg-ZUI104]|uniref:CDP-alcohol phosphatidyltransferase family protein n=1 Tax=Nocardioides faecalis TaxID=2803858 RepID=UPI001BCAFF6C|nr:CDP-alcohol phosphatidyltransferase family protein [Nocardioides faecalis]MBS4751290.1 CDP-alcohol phosphatidyltransferase family protein [Nocardioides faecalis]